MEILMLFAFMAAGFVAAGLLSDARRKDETNWRRCKNCGHCKPLPEGVPDYFKEGYFSCAACRGEDYDFPKENVSVSIVSPEGFCNEFSEKEL